MSIIKKSPSKYVHSTGMLQQLDQYLQGMGKILLILISESWPRRIGRRKNSGYDQGYRVLCGITGDHHFYGGFDRSPL